MRIVVNHPHVNSLPFHRFATELAGRKARRRGWEGLAEEMARAGWFDG